MIENISVKLTPFLGASKNLIEYFGIIGYEEKLLSDYSSNILENEQNLKLSVIYNIESNLSNNLFNINDIIEQIYPYKPIIIKNIKNVKSDMTGPGPSPIIFYSCFDSVEGNKKIIHSYYALKYYEKYIDSNSKNEYYIPKALLIISRYPYFTIFHKICLNLYNYYKVKDIENIEKQIPIEILLFYIVNCISSPIDKNINLKIFPKDKIKIPKLSGYPYVDFNLFEIINEISIKEFLKIYILIFLELDLLFFSSNHEKLNAFMFILYILNYPLVDSSYFWNIRTLSKNRLKTFIQPNFTSFFGVNTDYDKSINLSGFLGLTFVVDLENKKHNLMKIRENKDSGKIDILLEYVNNILNGRKVRSFFLSFCLSSLIHKLEEIKKEYEKNYKNKKCSYFYLDENIKKINRKVQEIFYDFVLNMIEIMNKDYILDEQSSSIIENKNNKNCKLSEEEKIFLDFHKKTVKYYFYYNNFIQSFKSMDEMRISLIFCDEFVNLKINDEKERKLNSIKYFDIIDKLYYNSKIDEEVNFNTFYEDYKKNIKNFRNENEKEKGKENIQLFDLNKNIRNHISNFKSLILKEPSEKLIESNYITFTIKYNLDEHFNEEYCIRSWLIYIYSVVFPLFSSENNNHYLRIILNNLKEIIYFQRYYISIILKSINKYYAIYNKKGTFPELTLENIKKYCHLIKDYLIKNSIIPNEEIFLYLNNILNNKIDKRQENKNGNEIIENGNTSKFIFQYVNEENIINNVTNDIVIRRKESLILAYKGEETKYNLFDYITISKIIDSIYNNYFTRINFNIEKFHIKKFIEIIVNMIFLFKYENSKDILCFLLNSIIALMKLEKDLNSFKGKESNK